MKTHVKEAIKFRSVLTGILMTALLMLTSGNVSAHCDTMDGPVIKDARLAFEKNNINYVLKWVQPANEAELKEAFMLAMKVRKLGPEALTLAERYFFETLVRLHRNGEGVSYTGLLPSGTPVNKNVLLADQSIEAGSLKPLEGTISGPRLHGLEDRFNKVMALKDYDVNNVEAGRKYVGAYVSFFKYAEGEEAEHAEHNHH